MTRKSEALIHIILDRTISECEARIAAEHRLSLVEKAAAETVAEAEKAQFERFRYQEAVDRAEALISVLRNVKLSTAARDAIDELNEAVLACRNFDNTF